MLTRAATRRSFLPTALITFLRQDRSHPLALRNRADLNQLDGGNRMNTMPAPKEMDVIRRAYELWQQAGRPSNKDDEFYFQAKKELQEALDNGRARQSAEQTDEPPENA